MSTLTKFSCTLVSAAIVSGTAMFVCSPTPAAAHERTVVDLTHVLGPDCPNYLLGAAGFTYKVMYTVKKDGYANGYFCAPEHFGTHIDAPSHFVDGGESIDQISADKLVRHCVVIDVRNEAKKDANYVLTVEKIKAFEADGEIPAGCVVLLNTGWSARWGTPTEYRNPDAEGTMHFPSFSPESADYLIKKRHVVGLGIDTISADYGLSKTFDVHKQALSAGLFLIENLNNLDKLPARGALLICGALPVKNGTGAPSRILAIIEDKNAK